MSLVGILSVAAFFNRQSLDVEAMAIFGAGFSVTAIGAITCHWLNKNRLGRAGIQYGNEYIWLSR